MSHSFMTIKPESFDPDKVHARMAEACRCAGEVAEELIGNYFAYHAEQAKELLELMPQLCAPRLDSCIAQIRAGARLLCECDRKHAPWLQQLVAGASPIHDYAPRREHVLRYRALVQEYVDLLHIAAIWQTGNQEAFAELLDAFHDRVCRVSRTRNTLPMVSVANAPDLPAPLFLNGPPPGGFGLIIGSDGIGKGWLTLDLLLGCMLARPMNVPRFRRDAATLRVMYLSYEDDTCVLRGRLDAVCAAAGVEAALWRDAEADGRFRTLTDLGPLFTQYGCNPPVATDTFRGLEAALRREQTELCVIDPLAAAMAVQNENDNCTLNGVAIALRRLAAETGCAILVTHHTSKAQREAEEHHAARGGSALTGAARWVLRVIQNGADSARLTVNIPKNNYGPALPAVHLERTRSGPLREINEEQVRTFRENLLQNVVRIVRENPDTEINPNGIRNNCSPGARLLCAKTRAGSRHVADAVQQAIAAGLLTVEQRRRKGNGRIYSVLVPLSSPAP